MKLHRQFLILHAMYGGADSVSVTLEEVAAALECTHRSALTVVHRMAGLGWIEWASARGRGQRSVLRFAASSGEIAAEAVLGALKHGDIQRALAQIGDRSQTPAVRQQLQSWLIAYFGRHSEERSDRRRFDTLRLPIRQRIQTLDPLRMNLLAEAFVSSHVFDSLVTRSGPDSEIEPHLAHDWDTDRNGTRWTFYLRKGVQFHDGRELHADDVVRSFERLTGSSLPVLYRSILQAIESVRAVGAGEVEFRLKERNGLFLPFLCTSRAAIVAAATGRSGSESGGRNSAEAEPKVEADGRGELVGTGPFVARELADGGCVLEAFPAYFRGRAQLDRAEVVYVPWTIGEQPADDAAPFHIIHSPSAATGGHWRTLPSTASIRKFMTCNLDKPGSLSDPAVRAHIGECLGVPAAGDDSASERTEPDMAVRTEKRELRGEPSKVSNGSNASDASNAPAGSDASNRPSRCSALTIATIPPYEQDAKQAAELLNAAGYACSVLLLKPAQFAGELRLQADLILFSLYKDRDLELRQYDLYTTAAAHFPGPVRREIDSLLRAAADEPDRRARAALFERIEARLIDERLLFILSERPVQTASLPEVRGLSFNSQGWVDLRKLWFPGTATAPSDTADV